MNGLVWIQTMSLVPARLLTHNFMFPPPRAHMSSTQALPALIAALAQEQLDRQVLLERARWVSLEMKEKETELTKEMKEKERELTKEMKEKERELTKVKMEMKDQELELKLEVKEKEMELTKEMKEKETELTKEMKEKERELTKEMKEKETELTKVKMEMKDQELELKLEVKDKEKELEKGKNALLKERTAKDKEVEMLKNLNLRLLKVEGDVTLRAAIGKSCRNFGKRTSVVINFYSGGSQLSLFPFTHNTPTHRIFSGNLRSAGP